MPRAGLNTDRVVAAAMELADEVGLDRLTLAALAVRLGVRQPSLYKHVASLDALQRLISIRAKVEAADVLAQAAIGRARDDALIAMAWAWRAWALAHPGRYQASQRGAAPGDTEHEQVARRSIGVLGAVIDGYGLAGDDAIDAIRAYRAALHGFVSLEADHGFAFPNDVERSFDRLVRALVLALSSWSSLSGPGGEVPDDRAACQGRVGRMDGVIVWVTFAGAWLLVAGPLYQGSVELNELDVDREGIQGKAAAAQATQARPSAWWWLLPPVMYVLHRRWYKALRREMLASSPSPSASS